MMKAKLRVLAIMCLLTSACAAPAPQHVVETPTLYEQYIVYGGYQDVLASIDAKVEQCIQSLPHKESSLQQEPGTAAMYFFGDNETALLVLKLKDFDGDRTQVDVYAGDLNKLAWPRLRRSIQYGAEGKAGCPDSPQADLSS